MSRRFGFAGVVAAMAVVLTGCPTPPPGYQPPTIESIAVSPEPVQAGDTLSIHIEASDDHSVTGGVPRYLFTPSGVSLSALSRCTFVMTPQDDPGDRPHVSIEVTCPIPDYALNGTWQIELLINDSRPPTANYPGRTIRVPFEVVGGTEDREPPTLVHYDIEPEVVDQETTFTLTMRLRDEAPVSIGQYGSGAFEFAKLFASHSRFRCRNATFTDVSATEVDVVVECFPYNYSNPGRAEAGTHRSMMVVSDALGHEGLVEMFVEVVPAAGG